MITKSHKEFTGIYAVTFSFENAVAREAKQVQLLGDFNNWDYSQGYMKKNATGFHLTLELNPGRYEFRYFIDGHRWENDWAADDYVPSPYAGVDNSLVVIEAVRSLPQMKDSLQTIEGIGPKIAAILEQKGISTYEGLAGTLSSRLRDILEEAGSRFRVHDPSTWPEQAALARDGKWEELKELQEFLKGGRRPTS